jgi:hypothetical protein
MVEVRILLTILHGNGGAEPRLMDLRRQTQHKAVHLIPPVAGGRISNGKTEGFIGHCGGGRLIGIFLIVMVKVSLLLTILYGNGGAEPRLTEL